MRRLRNFITYANVMASLAIVLAMGGTAFAAIVLTGRNVKDSSLTGIDVKNGSLTAYDLSLAARNSFKGAKGTTGTMGITGARGLTGATGPKGDTGAPGAPAEVVTSFASRDTGFVTRVDAADPNTADLPWFEYNCGNTGAAGPCALDDGNQTNIGVGSVNLIASDTLVIALSGMPPKATNETNQSNNVVTVPWSNNLTGMATVSLMHRGPVGQETAIHERVECGLEYANSTNPSSFAPLGEPQMVSSFGTREIVNLSLVGSANLMSGAYNVRVVCSDMDYASASDHGWRFIRGNLTVMAARNG